MGETLFIHFASKLKKVNRGGKTIDRQARANESAFTSTVPEFSAWREYLHMMSVHMRLCWHHLSSLLIMLLTLFRLNEGMSIAVWYRVETL